MNVLVIGANGQVGKHLIQQLQESEHTSIAMVRKKGTSRDDERARSR